jgi:hypothetical protein
MNRWPPVLWIGVSIASLLIVRGSVGGVRPPWLIAGGALLAVVFLISLYLALRPGQGPMRPLLAWSIAGLFALYLMFAAAASLAGWEYAVAALLAGTVPLTALNLWVANVRRRTAEGEDAPFPGLALDDETPVGASPEHSDAQDEEAGPRPTPRFQRRRPSRHSVER